MTKPTAKPKRITADQLARLDELTTTKRELDRQSRAMETEIAQLRKIANADLTATGKPQAKRHGFVLRWKMVAGRVDWKGALITETSAEHAADLQDKVPQRKSLEIVPA